jgi:predicted Fe-Mo cluster-binding NifX family protein
MNWFQKYLILEDKNMKYAIPVIDGELCMHFGHCPAFSIIEVDDTTKTIIAEETLTPPPHEPGLLPRWLSDKGVHCIIAGGMGQRAQQLFEAMNIKVIAGATRDVPTRLVEELLNDRLVTGENTCDH